jgi:hypothetical protein
MDLLTAFILPLGLPLAGLLGWFVAKGHGGLGSLVDPGGSTGWWQSTMPWPQGVQEEDGVSWHVQDPDPAVAPSEEDEDAFEVTPIRPRTRVGIRTKPPS